MGNLDWGSKFSLDMSQNKGGGKKIHPVERNKFCFWPISPFFWWNWPKIKKMLKIAFYKATTLIKTQNSQFWLLGLLCIYIGL